MAQVKFYSMSALPETPNSDGVYFIQGGELYKGSSRFGLGRVTKASTAEAFAALSDMARGDINVGYEGAKVWDGSAWQPLGGDTAELQSMWRSDIKEWTGSFASGDSASYIAYIDKDGDGKLTAHALPFPTLNLGASTVTGSDCGIYVDVTTQSGAVTGVTVSADDIVCDSVSATAGTFTTLTVSTADFNVTNVSTTTLTINGSTVEQLADKQIAAIAASTVTSASNGITVSVTTQGGSVTAVSMDASAFGNVMHFKGVYASTGDVSDAVAGDIIVIGSEPATGFVAGQEWICTASEPETWELIGDQNTYALNAYSSTATVYTNVTNVPGALNAAGAAIDALNAANGAKASVGSDTTAVLHGISAAVTLASDAEPTLSITVDAITASTGIETGVDKVVTAGAVADFVSDAISTATAYSPSAGAIVDAQTTTLGAAVHAIAGAFDTLKSKTDAYVGGTSSSTASGITASVSIASDTMAPTVSLAVDASALATALNLGTAAFANITTSIDANGASLPTESAVAAYVIDQLTWLTA